MQKHRMKFSTFLKLAELKSDRAEKELRKYLKGGGYDFWSQFRNHVEAVACKKYSATETESLLANIGSVPQRKHTLRALTQTLAWSTSHSVQVAIERPSVKVDLGKSGLSVVLEPELALTIGSKLHLVHVWPTEKPKISSKTLSLGLLLFREMYKAHALPASQFMLFNAVSGMPFFETQIEPDAQAALAAAINSLDTLWKKVCEAAEVADDATTGSDASFPTHFGAAG